jgi:hypothetical protein
MLSLSACHPFNYSHPFPLPAETNLLYLLLDKLQPGEPVEAQSNAAEILAALAQSQVSPLTRNLAEPYFLEVLVERALRQPEGLASAAAAAEAAPAAAATVAEAPASASANGTASKAGAAAAADAAAAAAAPSAEAAAAEAASSYSGGSSSAMMHALNVCIALVEPLPPSPAEQQAAAQGLGMGALPVPAIDAAAEELHAAMRGQAIQCMSKSIDRLVALLEAVDGSRKLPTSYGLLQPPVGLARLKAVELLAALLHSGDEAAGALSWAPALPAGIVRTCAVLLGTWREICVACPHVCAAPCPVATRLPVAAESAVMGTRGVQRSLELFLQYPFNNVLHRHVATLVVAVGRGSPALAEFLVHQCRLLTWLVEAPVEVSLPVCPPACLLV